MHSKGILTSLILLATTLPQSRNLSLTEILKREGPAVVLLEARNDAGEAFVQASGVVVHAGIIVTNAHVLDGACNVTVALSGDSQPRPVAGIVSYDLLKDIAILRFEGEAWSVATVGDSRRDVGERVVAIGNPKGLERSVSDGVISGIRKVDSGNLIQFTAPISPGSSGGGLYNLTGKLIGITSATLQEAQNINFAVPIEEALAVEKYGSNGEGIPWAKVSGFFCHGGVGSLFQNTARLDWELIGALLGRPFADPVVQQGLQELGGGRTPEPVFGVLPGAGEWRGYWFHNLGIVVHFQSGRCSAIDLYGRDVKNTGMKGFQGILPFGLSWSSNRGTILKSLGAPINTVDARTSSRFQTQTGERIMPDVWVIEDRHVFGNRQYLLRFDDSGRLAQISVGVAIP